MSYDKCGAQGSEHDEQKSHNINR